MGLQVITLRYLFDPLCGWCYASAPALAAVSDQYPTQLQMMPSGLFMEARPVSQIADHAWTNDQRISELTGQPFSSAYRHDVLLAPDGVFDSTFLTQALVALGEVDSVLEARFLHAAQIARFVDGRDTSRLAEVVKVAAVVAPEVVGGSNQVAVRLMEDPSLHAHTARRVSETREILRRLPSRGVPQLLVTAQSGQHLVDSGTLYGGRHAILPLIERLMEFPG